MPSTDRKDVDRAQSADEKHCGQGAVLGVAAFFRTPRIKSPVTKRQRPAETVALERSRDRRARAYHREDLNLSQQPSQRCVPSLERWLNSRSGGNRTLRSFAPNERTLAGLARLVIVSPEITAVSPTSLESLAGIAPARTVRETAGLLLSNRDKDGQGTGLGGAFTVCGAAFQRHHRAVCRRSYSSSCEGRAVSTQRLSRAKPKPRRDACCFAIWVAPASLP